MPSTSGLLNPLICRPKRVRLNTPVGSTGVALGVGVGLGVGDGFGVGRGRGVGVRTAALDVTDVVLDQPGGGTAGVTLPRSSLARRTGRATQAKSAAMRGISENAFSVIVRNAQNSAPSKNDILSGRDRRCFFLVIIFIADVASSLFRAAGIKPTLFWSRWGFSHYNSAL
jgi:hypothetical protein